jgi:hypothetical protein
MQIAGAQQRDIQTRNGLTEENCSKAIDRLRDRVAFA